MSAAERVYRLLLRAYPPEFRGEYGREMVVLFRDRRRELGASSGAGFWVEMVWDVARSAPALRLEAWRARREVHTQLEGGTMKTMAISTVLVGALIAVDTFAEGWRGGVTYHDPLSIAAGVLGVIAGLLLLTAGVAMLRRAPRAAVLARRAAIVCLVALIAFVPRMGGFAILLTIVFPIVLLVYLRVTRGPSVPTTV